MAEERSEIATRLFLVGCPRSGTTLLQSLLAAHPALTSFPETHAFAHLVPAPRFFRALGLSRPRGFVPMLRLWRELAPAARRPFWTLLTHRPAARRFVGLLDHLARERGRQGWVEKTPRHLHYLEEIRRACPDARFIHLLRPGEEVVASLVEASRAAPGVWRGDRSVPASAAR